MGTATMLRRGTRLTARVVVWVLLAIGTVLSLALAWAQNTSVADRQKTITADGRSRSYILHVPPAYDAQRALPLVIVLHGGGGNAQNAARMTGFTAKADQEGFLVAYPNGTGRLGDRLLTWNSGNCCGYARSQNVDDTAFIRAMLDAIEREMKVDAKRIFATGMSNGGMMSYRLGCELSDRIAAIAPVAGALNLEKCAPAQSVSLIAFHGTADQHVLYEGGPPKKRADLSPRIDKPVSYAIETFRTLNKCAGTPKREAKGKVTTEFFEDCSKGTAVALYTIQDEGHTWPGGRSYPGGDTPAREIFATDIMWDFFAQHPRR